MKETNDELNAKLLKYENEESDSEEDDDDESVCDKSPWSVKYFILKQFKAQHGHCSVPRSHKDLGFWVNNQRKAYKKKTMAKERIEKLDNIGFLWSKDQKPPPSWQDFFQEGGGF